MSDQHDARSSGRGWMGWCIRLWTHGWVGRKESKKDKIQVEGRWARRGAWFKSVQRQVRARRGGAQQGTSGGQMGGASTQSEDNALSSLLDLSQPFPRGSWPQEARWLIKVWETVRPLGPKFWAESIQVLEHFAQQDTAWTPECVLALSIARHTQQDPVWRAQAVEMVALSAFLQQMWLATEDPEKGDLTRSDPGFDALEDCVLRYAQEASAGARMVFGLHWGARRTWGHSSLSKADFSKNGAWGARIAQVATAQWEAIALQAQWNTSASRAQDSVPRVHTDGLRSSEASDSALLGGLPEKERGARRL